MEFTEDNTSQFVELDHGTVHYHEAGTGPTLLLIHGSGPGVTGWANYQGNLAFFANRFRCIVVDLPGYGKSDSVGGDPVTGCVNVVVSLLDKLNIDKAHIIGNSLGGIVGSHIAAQHPQRVTSFTTIGGIGLNLFSAFPGEGLNLLTAFTEDPTRERVEVWLRSMVYDQSLVTDALIDSRFKQATEPKTLATTRELYSRESIQRITAFRQGEHATKTIEHLPSIIAPTLITWGRDDRVSPMDIALIPMRLIPNCELHVFSNCGHWAMIECKEQFESLVHGFLVLHEPSFH
ncbi:4,5:9,10-diseco-3-hydroxy-5,9,17-trioxoandrosta-1 (10),2-diene-4-oate hydrolase [BD1-7 clade bacterium]|uniref:4,5:9,10-diseco-3-hydroxy-5,9,17-trioxoandrosta-1 (10),2-diene-4-oate hydrolase n=1 Tax=BD1-7 clade bacterium TaxID=2029982 RepID=A0A5S9NPN7_9GAMM|nr:4,5:9,10-diseco-3-hydroxy-5,9,17-trioxoandrosta-1 (10),2-diene-4-oate hydrolase [BD1-7 clade bacterium]